VQRLWTSWWRRRQRPWRFFHGLSPNDLERPATASDAPGAAPWRAKDHLAHLANSERRIQELLRSILAGETRDVILGLQYPEGMPLPGVLGDLSALTPEEEQSGWWWRLPASIKPM
jgi:hypothetical protein